MAPTRGQGRMLGLRKDVPYGSCDAGHIEHVVLLLRLYRRPPFLLPLVRRHRALHGSIVAGIERARAGPVLRWRPGTAAPAGPQLVTGPGSRELGAPDLA